MTPSLLKIKNRNYNDEFALLGYLNTYTMLNTFHKLSHLIAKVSIEQNTLISTFL